MAIKLYYNKNTYQLITIDDNSESIVVGDTGGKEFHFYFGTGTSLVSFVNDTTIYSAYLGRVVIERADTVSSGELYLTPMNGSTEGYYKLIVNEWISAIEGDSEFTARLKVSDGNGGYIVTAFGVATIPVEPGTVPGDDTITLVQYNAIMDAVDAVIAGTTPIAYDNATSGLIAVTLDEAVDEIDNDVDALDVRLTEDESDIVSLETFQNTTVPATYETIVDADTHRERTTTLESEMNTAQGDIDAVEVRLDTAESNIVNLESGTTVIPTYVPKTTTIIGLDLQDNILIGEFRTAVGDATTSFSGLLSAADKTHLDNLVALLEDSDGDTVVDTIGEILAIFNSYPEGADLVTALAGKVDKVTGKSLSTNDLTDILKYYYDSAYTHSQITNGANPHNTTFANLANKPTTVDGYGITDVYKKTQTYTQAEIDALLNGLQTSKGLQNTLLTPTELTNGQTIETTQLTTNKTFLMFVATNQDNGEIDSDIIQVSSILTGTKFVFFDNENITFTIGETNSTFLENGNYTLKINALEIASDLSAEELSYDNTESEREATNVQEALDEAFGEIDSHVGSTSNPHSVTAEQVGAYTTTQSDTNFEPKNANIQSHISSTNNPHVVTKSQVGLGNADNTSDVNKPISTATQTALNGKANSSHTHTKSQITDFPTSMPPTEHSTDLLTSGTLGVARGGTGRTDGYAVGVVETRASVLTKIWTGTQAQYDAIGTKDADTLYFII